jgi:hypothetical protein
MQDQAGFDSFAKADFVREKYAGGEAAYDFGSNIELVRNEIDAAADEAAHVRLTSPMLLLQRGDA